MNRKTMSLIGLLVISGVTSAILIPWFSQADLEVSTYPKGSSIMIAKLDSRFLEQGDDTTLQWKVLTGGQHTLKKGAYYYRLILKNGRQKNGLVEITRSDALVLK